jgi:hypothetical protein
MRLPKEHLPCISWKWRLCPTPCSRRRQLEVFDQPHQQRRCWDTVQGAASWRADHGYKQVLDTLLKTIVNTKRSFCRLFPLAAACFKQGFKALRSNRKIWSCCCFTVEACREWTLTLCNRLLCISSRPPVRFKDRPVCRKPSDWRSSGFFDLRTSDLFPLLKKTGPWTVDLFSNFLSNCLSKLRTLDLGPFFFFIFRKAGPWTLDLLCQKRADLGTLDLGPGTSVVLFAKPTYSCKKKRSSRVSNHP